MTPAAAPSGPPQALPHRPRLRAVGPDGPDGPVGPVGPVGPPVGEPSDAPAATAAPVLVLRRLPQPQPERWSPAAAPGEHAPTPSRRAGSTRSTGPDGSGQQAFALDGVPRPLPEPDPAPPVSTPSEDLPCPEQLARSLVQAVVDVVRGHRPASQVLRWTTPEVYSQLRQRARLEQSGPRPGGRRPVVRSLRLSPCGPSGVEVSAVVLDGPRARAVAARLDGEDSRWRLTALVIG